MSRGNGTVLRRRLKSKWLRVFLFRVRVIPVIDGGMDGVMVKFGRGFSWIPPVLNTRICQKSHSVKDFCWTFSLVGPRRRLHPMSLSPVKMLPFVSAEREFSLRTPKMSPGCEGRHGRRYKLLIRCLQTHVQIVMPKVLLTQRNKQNSVKYGIGNGNKSKILVSTSVYLL